ncbi:CG5500 [Drosophila busckii]|uniref:CG5500 n=1 Tax=Drosophila busckii TaxID=30019 RepID=A0A0M4F6C2_DROBS|nr:oxidoreductase-like domain-containing protein 1 [Drosophila busckii]ALC47587.1 CG5500 [Drosophila busckii]
MLAPLCLSCPRCQLLGRHGVRLARAVLAKQLADNKGSDIEIPPEPTNCCMSGCANCVWIEYAQTLTKLLEGNGERAREIVLSKIQDPNLRMFLELELRNIKLKSEEEKQTKGEPKPQK